MPSDVVVIPKVVGSQCQGKREELRMADPFVSIVLPVRNEEPHIARCLDAVLHQTYPQEALEIIVADGESSDATVRIIHSLPGAERIRVVANPGHTAPTGLNRAIAHARGDIILRIDGHAIIAPDYVRQSVRALQETAAGGVGGCLRPIGATPMGKAIAAAMGSRFGIPSAYHVATRPQYTDQVYLGAWPRSAFERIGGFDERLRQNQDYEFNYRIRKYVGRLYLTPAIQSDYYGRQSLATLIQQFFRYGLAKPMMLWRHPTSVKPRQLIAALFLPSLAVGAALAPFLLWARLALIAVVALYAVLSVGFSLISSIRQAGGSGFLFRLPLIFFLIHSAWGIGFWLGMFVGLPRAKGEHSHAPTWEELRNTQVMSAGIRQIKLSERS